MIPRQGRPGVTIGVPGPVGGHQGLCFNLINVNDIFEW